MVIYKCEICNKLFKQKCHFDNHKKRKKPCQKTAPNNTKQHQNNTDQIEHKMPSSTKFYTDDNTSNINEYQCKYCNKKFTRNWTMFRHVENRCKVKKQNDDEKEYIFQQLLKEMEVIKKKNDVLEKQLVQLTKVNDKNKIEVQNNIVNGTVNNGTVNNIVLVKFGREDLDGRIDKSDILRAIKYGYHTPIKLTETVHFNPKYPEYHNIYISNTKDKYAMVYDGAKWGLIFKSDVVDNLYDDYRSYVEENLDKFYESLHQTHKNSLKRWLDTDDEDPKTKNTKEIIKIMLYNLREIPMKTRKLINDQ